MGLFSEKKPYTRPVYDPSGTGYNAKGEPEEFGIDDKGRARGQYGKRYHVTMKTLSANDKTKLEDTVRMRYGDEGEVESSLLQGTMRRTAVELALLSWDFVDSDGLPVPVTPLTIGELDSAVFEQVWSWVSFSGTPPDPDEEDAGEDPTEPSALPDESESSEKTDKSSSGSKPRTKSANAS